MLVLVFFKNKNEWNNINPLVKKNYKTKIRSKTQKFLKYL